MDGIGAVLVARERGFRLENRGTRRIKGHIREMDLNRVEAADDDRDRYAPENGKQYREYADSEVGASGREGCRDAVGRQVDHQSVDKDPEAEHQNGLQAAEGDLRQNAGDPEEQQDAFRAKAPAFQHPGPGREHRHEDNDAVQKDDIQIVAGGGNVRLAVGHAEERRAVGHGRGDGLLGQGEERAEEHEGDPPVEGDPAHPVAKTIADGDHQRTPEKDPEQRGAGHHEQERPHHRLAAEKGDDQHQTGRESVPESEEHDETIEDAPLRSHAEFRLRRVDRG